MDYLALIDEKQHFIVIGYSADSLADAVRFANDTFCFDFQTVLGVWTYTDYMKMAFADNEQLLSAFLSALFVSNLAYSDNTINSNKSKRHGKSR